MTTCLPTAPPVSPRRRVRNALFRPPLDEAVLARRCAGKFLVLTRKALTAFADNPDTRSQLQIANAFAYQARALLGELRALEVGDEPGFRAMMGRVLHRFGQIRAVVPVLADAAAVVSLLEVELLVLSGDLALARAGIEPMMQAVHRVQGRDLRDEIAIRYLDICIADVRSRSGFIAFIDYLSRRLSYDRACSRFARELRLIAMHAALLQGAGLGRTARLVRTWSRLVRVPPRRVSSLVADLLMQRLGPSVMQRELRSIAPFGGPVRVVRSMGGIGDLLMMTPGLRALSRRIGQPVAFGIPGRYLELFENNPFVRAAALETLPAAWFRDGPVIDLTECPASIVESRSAPAITVNRIEIFAEAMGIGARELRKHGVRPEFEPSPEGKRNAERWLRSEGLWGRPFIAVQAAPAETYRAWSGMTETVRILAATMPVVVFDDKPPRDRSKPMPEDANVSIAVGLDLATSLSIACLASVILAPDSAFTHLAGARGIPCVGVFGPTDGPLRMRSYPGAIVASRAADLPCVPCWRNQSMPCMLTGGMASQCLDSLPVETVVAAMMRHIGHLRRSAPPP